MTPNKEDILFAKAVNDKLIATQTYDPFEIKEAYRRLFGEAAPNQHYARSRVFAYFQYIYKAVDTTETAVPTSSETISVSTTNQSHSEEVLKKESLLLQDLESALAVATDPKIIKTIKFKITTLKKKLNGIK